jgi:hypothetical protein
MRETYHVHVAPVVFIVVTLVVGVGLTRLAGQPSPFVWLVAITVGLLAAIGTRSFGGASRRPVLRRRRREDDAPTDGWRCPLCGGTGLEPGRTGPGDPPQPTCRQCGGRGYVYEL